MLTNRNYVSLLMLAVLVARRTCRLIGRNGDWPINTTVKREMGVALYIVTGKRGWYLRINVSANGSQESRPIGALKSD